MNPRTLPSLIVLTIFLASLLAPVAPIVAKAAELPEKVTTSRDKWGNLWYNMTIEVCAYFTTKPEEDTLKDALKVYVNGNPVYATNITYKPDTYYEYCTKLVIYPDGNFYDPVKNKNFTTLSPDDVVKFVVMGVESKELTFKHIKPELKLPSTKMPYPLNKTYTGDWELTAPDANTAPDVVDYFCGEVKATIVTRGIDKGPVTVCWKETGENTGVFKPLNTTIFDDLGLTGSVATPYDQVEVKVSIKYYSDASTVDTETASFFIEEILSTIAKIKVVKATLRELVIEITDPDENKNFADKDTIPVTIVSAANTSVVLYSGTAKETDDASGVFKLTVEPYKWITNATLRKYFNNTYTDIEVKVVTGYYNSGKGDYDTTTITKSASIEYYTAEITFTTEEGEKTILLPPADEIKKGVTPRGMVIITIKDADMNLYSDERDALDLSFPITSDAFEADIVHVGTGITFGKLILQAVRGDEEPVTVNRTSTCPTLRFVETGEDTGVFELRLPLSCINWTTLIDALGGYLPDKLIVVFKDYYNADLESEKEIKDEITVGKPTLEVDRTVIPLAPYTYYVKVKVVDPSAKGAGSVSVTVDIYNITDDKVYSTTATLTETGVETGEFEGKVAIDVKYLLDTLGIKPFTLDGGKVVISYGEAEAKLEIRAYDADVKVNGTSVVEAKYGDKVIIQIYDPDKNFDASEKDKFTITIGDGVTVELEETGPDTGVFEGEVTIHCKKLSPTTKGTTCVGEPGELVEVEYTDKLNTHYEEYTFKAGIKIKSFEGKLYINDKEGTVEVGPATKIVIKIVDPDYNFDPEAKDKIIVKARRWDGTLIDKLCEAEETDDSSGVFECELEPTQLLAALKISYSDLTEAYSKIIGKMIELGYTDQYTPSGVKSILGYITFISWDGVIKTYKKTPEGKLVESDTFMPGDYILIRVIDKDANLRPDARDTVEVTISSTSMKLPIRVSLKETEENSGVFEGWVKLTSEPGITEAVYVKYGDTVTISYTDEFPAGYTGESKTIIKTVSIGVVKGMPSEVKEACVKVKPEGPAVTKVGVGSTVLLTAKVKNYANEPLPAVIFIQVKDHTGAVVYLVYHVVTIPAGEEYTVMSAWTPTKADVYTIEVYVWSSLTAPKPLAEMATTTLQVVS